MALVKKYSWRTISGDGIVKFLPEKWEGTFNDTFASIEEADRGMEEYFARNNKDNSWGSVENCFLVCDISWR